VIHFFAEDTQLPKLKKRKISAWIQAVAAVYNKKAGEISYMFCNDDKILEVNRQYLKHDYYTDIITFDYSEKNIISGDIYISIDTVRSNAESLSVDFDNEVLRIIIHGILHLCGNNDKSPEERADMTNKENQALKMWDEIATTF